MKTTNELLVLGPSDMARDWSNRFRRYTHRRRESGAAERLDEQLARACGGVLVVNDRSANAVDHLNWARSLQARHPKVAVAVLTIIEPRDDDPLETALALADPAKPGMPARIETEQAMAVLAPHLRGLQICETEAGITIEYAG